MYNDNDNDEYEGKEAEALKLKDFEESLKRIEPKKITITLQLNGVERAYQLLEDEIGDYDWTDRLLDMLDSIKLTENHDV